MLQAHEAPRRPSRSGFRAGSCEFVPKHGLIGFLLWKCRAWQKKSAGWAMHCFGARGSRVHRVVGEIVWAEIGLGFQYGESNPLTAWRRASVYLPDRGRRHWRACQRRRAEDCRRRWLCRRRRATQGRLHR